MGPVTHLPTPHVMLARFDSDGHLLLRVEHHVATRHRGGVDLALVEDVAVVWVTWHVTRDMIHVTRASAHLTSREGWSDNPGRVSVAPTHGLGLALNGRIKTSFYCQ